MLLLTASINTFKIMYFSQDRENHVHHQLLEPLGHDDLFRRPVIQKIKFQL